MCVVPLQMSDSKAREEQLKKQIAEKEEKTKKVFMGAKTKINQLNSKSHQHVHCVGNMLKLLCSVGFRVT